MLATDAALDFRRLQNGVLGVYIRGQKKMEVKRSNRTEMEDEGEKNSVCSVLRYRHGYRLLGGRGNFVSETHKLMVPEDQQCVQILK